MKDVSNDIFQETIGHKHEVSHLVQLLENRHVPHALLFSGQSGIGKHFMARAFAYALLLGTTAEKGSATPKPDEVRRLVNSGTHPDLHDLDLEEGKKDISVEAVRELCSKLHFAPYYAGCRIAVINDAHRMSIAASNSLLMTLEEPSANTFLFLISEAGHRLPQTIISRCQTIHFGALKDYEVETILKRIFSETKLEPGLLKILTEIAQGSLAVLGLDPFISRSTLSLEDSKGALEHLEALGEEIHTIKLKIGTLIKRNPGGMSPAAFALSIASEFAEEKGGNQLFWRILQLELRRNLRAVAPSDMEYFATNLLNALKAESSVRERNTNTALQLSTLFLDLAEPARA